MPPKAASAAPAQAVVVTDSDMQVTLFRLTILLATSLASLHEAHAPTVHASSSALPAPAYYGSLAAQLHADVLALLALAQKCASSLTLALRRGARQPAPSGSTSATAGMDAASLAAAKQQLDTLAHEVLPKLAFLCAKAHADACVLLSLDVAPSAEEAAERARIAKEVEALGGRVLLPAGQRRKVAGLGVGRAFAKALAQRVEAVLEALVELFTVLMDARTHAAVAKAAAARARADGLPRPVVRPERTAAASAAQARELALQATAKVWAACDEAAKEMPRNNGEAVGRKWREREEVMDDGWEELRAEAGVEEDDAEGDAPGNAAPVASAPPATQSAGLDEEEEDDDDPLAHLQDMQLSPAEKRAARRYVPLLKLGRILHRAAGRAALAASPSPAERVQEQGQGQGQEQEQQQQQQQQQAAPLDLDELDALAQRLAERQDDLVAALLYGGADGLELESLGSGSDAASDAAGEGQESDEDEDAEEQDTASTCAAYVGAALALAAALGVRLDTDAAAGAAQEKDKAAGTTPAQAQEAEAKARHTVRMCAEGMRKLAASLGAPEAEGEAEP